MGRLVFSCDDCKFYKPDGWTQFTSANGSPIHEGPCKQYVFYNHEAARSACKGILKEAVGTDMTAAESDDAR